MQHINTREAWLRACLTRVTAGWPVGSDLPENTHISVGFPHKGRGRGAGRVIESYEPEQSDGGHWEIFVSPTVADSLEVARAVVMEAARIATHRAPTAGEIETLGERARRVCETLPPYPHSALKVGAHAPGKPPEARLIKVTCPECRYTMGITRKWLRIKVPVCPFDAAHGIMRADTAQP